MAMAMPNAKPKAKPTSKAPRPSAPAVALAGVVVDVDVVD